jgi:hypothetical protein
VAYTTNLVIPNLARRVLALNLEVKEIDRLLVELIDQTAQNF